MILLSMISILSLNTWKCDSNYEQRIPVIAQEIRKINPDLFLCQEVFHCSGEQMSTKDFLQEALDRKAYYFPSRQKERIGVNSFSGLSFFTNLEIIKYEELTLPTHEDDGDRTAQFISLEIDGKKIGIVNTHLTHLKNQENLRLTQFTTIHDHFHNKVDTLIICGDMNDDPQSELYRMAVEDYSYKTVFNNKTATHINGRKIDYIFYKSTEKIIVKNKEIVLDKVIGEVRPSDHFGLYTTLRIGN